jgi:hypothetical protein
VYRLDHVFWIWILTRLHSGYDVFYRPTLSASVNVPEEDTHQIPFCVQKFSAVVVVRLFSVSSVTIIVIIIIVGVVIIIIIIIILIIIIIIIDGLGRP